MIGIRLAPSGIQSAATISELILCGFWLSRPSKGMRVRSTQCTFECQTASLTGRKRYKRSRSERIAKEVDRRASYVVALTAALGSDLEWPVFHGDSSTSLAARGVGSPVSFIAAFYVTVANGLAVRTGDGATRADGAMARLGRDG